MDHVPEITSPVAGRVIDKCGGAKRVATITGYAESWVHRWRYPKSRGGTGGHIPAEAQRKLMDASVEHGIGLAPEDFFDLPQKAAS